MSRCALLKTNDERGTAVGAFLNLDVAIIPIDQSVDQIETDTTSRTFQSLFSAAEDFVSLRFRNSRAVIGDTHGNSLSIIGYVNPYLRLIRVVVPNRIGQEIAKDRGQCFVGEDRPIGYILGLVPLRASSNRVLSFSRVCSRRWRVVTSRMKS